MTMSNQSCPVLGCHSDSDKGAAVAAVFLLSFAATASVVADTASVVADTAADTTYSCDAIAKAARGESHKRRLRSCRPTPVEPPAPCCLPFVSRAQIHMQQKLTVVLHFEFQLDQLRGV